MFNKVNTIVGTKINFKGIQGYEFILGQFLEVRYDFTLIKIYKDLKSNFGNPYLILGYAISGATHL